jgi:RNA ligase
MHYTFPVITHINDVLPYIKDREEFIVAIRDDFDVVNYVVSMPTTFDIGDDIYAASVRRECRGLIFDKAGKLISRPYHKFFNVNEREETQLNNIDLGKPHTLLEKLDGSMIRPILINNQLRLATKMGITDVSMQSELWLANQKDYDAKVNWMRHALLVRGCTPIFEYMGPDNKIVVEYEKEDMVLTAIRITASGDYLSLEDDTCPFNIVPAYGTIDGSINEYVERAKAREGREGDVIRFNDGHMLKVKNDWYVRIHKVKDLIRYDRNIINLVINEEIDDVIPMFDESDQTRVSKLTTVFWEAFNKKEDELREVCNKAKVFESRKDVALEYIPTLENNVDARYIFGVLDGKDLRTMMIDFVQRSVGNGTKYNAVTEWLKMSS